MGKCRMVQENYIRPEGNKSLAAPVFAADSVDDLPGKNDLDKYILDIGSAAWIISEGKMYAMDGSGNWIRQGG